MNENKLVLIDRDGVILPKSPEIYIEILYETVKAATPIAKQTIVDYFKATSYKPYEAIQLLFKALGVDEAYDNFIVNAKTAKDHKDFHVAPGLDRFIAMLREKEMLFKVFSAASEEKIINVDYITSADKIEIKDVSKGSVKTFERVREMYNDKTDIYLIDDTPLVCRTAKLAGVTTIFMKTDLYSEEDQNLYIEYIDYTVSSFDEVLKLPIFS